MRATQTGSPKGERAGVSESNALQSLIKKRIRAIVINRPDLLSESVTPQSHKSSPRACWRKAST
jgi:hypothetical protein